MYNKVFERKGFIIFQVKEGYIAYNTKKNFEEGHTHLKNFNAAKNAIDLVISKKIPKSTNVYYLTSLVRLTNDKNYEKKIKDLIETRKQKGKKENYCNVSHRTS